MGASRRLSRQIKRAGQRAENRHLRAQVAALTEALEVSDAAPVFTDEQSPEEAWEAAGFTMDGSPVEPAPDEGPEPTELAAAFRRTVGDWQS